MAEGGSDNGFDRYLFILLPDGARCDSSVFQVKAHQAKGAYGEGHPVLLYRKAGERFGKHRYPLPCDHSQGAEIRREDRSCAGKYGGQGGAAAP